jgi:hypothetical protein
VPLPSRCPRVNRTVSASGDVSALPSIKPTLQRFRAIPPFISRFASAPNRRSGEELPASAVARCNLLSVLSNMVPDAFEKAIERYGSLDGPIRGFRGLAWEEPLRQIALAWAADWNLGDESHPEFAYMVFNFADLETRIRDERLGDKAPLFGLVQFDAMLPINRGDGIPVLAMDFFDCDFTDDYPVMPFLDQGEPLDAFRRRLKIAMKEATGVAEAHLRCERRRLSPTFVGNKKHYQWLLQRHVPSIALSLNDIADREKPPISPQAVSEAINKVARLIELTTAGQVGGRPSTV